MDRSKIENEYGNVMVDYGDAEKPYINWCANMAESLHIGVPWIMCQQPDTPQILNQCFFIVPSQIALEESLVNKGKESLLLIPQQTEIIASSIINHCSHHFEIQSIVLADTGNVDMLTYSVLPLDNGFGEAKEEPDFFSSTTAAFAYETFLQTADQAVFTWIIQNIETNLMNNVSQFPTAKALWEGLATTYGSGTDPVQIYDLHRKANTQKQGQDTLEDFWNKLQAIWMAIDRRQPNPMQCTTDIAIFNKIKQEQRLYQFLTGIDEKFEAIRRDLLMQEKTPLVESAYAAVRREAARLQILKPTTSSEGSTSLGEVGIGLVARNKQGQGPRWNRSETAGRRSSQREKEDKSHLLCTHCGMRKHTKETCFKIVGYPEWWEDPKPKNHKAATAVGNPQAASNSGGDAGRDKETESQAIHGRAAVAHGGR
ncbi:hypothetical protein HN51_001433 [Arachis hypogaea]